MAGASNEQTSMNNGGGAITLVTATTTEGSPSA